MGRCALRPQGGSGTAASATGLTGLNQSGANFSATWWQALLTVPENCFVWSHHSAIAPYRDGIAVRVQQRTNLRLTIGTASAAASVDSGEGCLMVGQWAPYAVVYDGVAVRFFRWGELFSRVAQTSVPTAGGTRLTVLGAATLLNPLFDVRVFPNTVLTPAEVRLAMDPRRVVPGCLQRLCLDWVPGASGVMRDQSGNGNDLTLSAALADAQSWPAPPARLWLGNARPRRRPALVAVSADAVIPMEALGGIAAAYALAHEALLTLGQGGAVGYEALEALAASAAAAHEALQSVGGTPTLGFEALAGVAGAQVLPHEAVGQVSGAIVVPFEALAQLAQTGQVPHEALTALAAGQVIAFEVLGGVALAAVIPHEADGQSTAARRRVVAVAVPTVIAGARRRVIAPADPRVH